MALVSCVDRKHTLSQCIHARHRLSAEELPVLGGEQPCVREELLSEQVEGLWVLEVGRKQQTDEVDVVGRTQVLTQFPKRLSFLVFQRLQVGSQMNRLKPLDRLVLHFVGAHLAQAPVKDLLEGSLRPLVLLCRQLALQLLHKAVLAALDEGILFDL